MVPQSDKSDTQLAEVVCAMELEDSGEYMLVCDSSNTNFLFEKVKLCPTDEMHNSKAFPSTHTYKTEGNTRTF